MDEKTRIQKDIIMFEENIKKIEKNNLKQSKKKNNITCNTIL